MAKIVGEVKLASSRVFLCSLMALLAACSSNPKQPTTTTSNTDKSYQEQPAELNNSAKNAPTTRKLGDSIPKPVAEPKPVIRVKPLPSQPPESKSAKPAASTTKATEPRAKPKVVVAEKPKVPSKKTRPKKLASKETKAQEVPPKPPAKKNKPTKSVTTTPTKPDVIAESVTAEPKPVLPSFKLDDLPIEFGNWVVNESRHDPNQCSLKTKAQSIEDGAGGTPVYLEIDGKRLTIRTKSDIDLSYPGSALQIGSTGFKLEGVNQDTDAYIETKLNQVVDGLKINDAAQITLGFWPTWPRTTTHTATIDISNAELALKGLAHCNSIIK